MGSENKNHESGAIYHYHKVNRHFFDLLVIGAVLYIGYRGFDQLDILNAIAFICVITGSASRLIRPSHWELTISKEGIKWREPEEFHNVMFTDITRIIVNTNEQYVFIMGKNETGYSIPKRCLTNFGEVVDNLRSLEPELIMGK
jgi:hypothetical protein